MRPDSPVVGGHMPSFETRPAEGLWPNTPQNSAGILIEPAMSEAIPNGELPEPTAAPSPPDEPPAVRRWSYGLLVRPYRRLFDSIHSVSSEVLVTPSGIAPASISRWTEGALVGLRYSRRATRPADCGMPSTAIVSLTVNGTPSSGGTSAPEAMSASAEAASSSAASKRSATTALIRGANRRWSSMCALTTSTAVNSRWRIASASETAERVVITAGRAEARFARSARSAPASSSLDR